MIARDKEMYVVGHYHVTPNRHVIIKRFFRVIDEGTMSASLSQNFPPTRCAKRNKEQGRIISLEYPMEPQRLIMTHITGVASVCRCSCRCLSGRILSSLPP